MILVSLKVLYHILGWECPTSLEIAYFYSVKAVPGRKNVAGGFYYLGTYIGDWKIIVRLPNKTWFKEDFFGTTGLSPINTITFRIIPIPRRPVPTPVIAKRHKILLSLQYGLRAIDFLLNEKILKNVGLLTSDEFTCDYKIPKYSSFQKVLVQVEEESMDVDLECMFKSPPLVDKKSKKRVPKMPAKSLEKGKKVSVVRNAKEQPNGSVHQAEMLKAQLHQTREHRDTLAKKWNNSNAEVSHTKEEVVKQRVADQKKVKELEDSLESLQADHEKKLKEMEAETKDRVISIGRRTIYQIWSANPDLDFSFLGDNADAMLAFCERTRREELGKE
uniref:Uncharacterized protein n=1 Tax=Cannabis sativa TaxID=3483 RepID=A0A803PJT1_CANSA